jgi:hypothetical protein
MTEELTACSHLTVGAEDGAAIGLNHGAMEYGLLMVKAPGGSRHTLVSEPGYLSMLVQASQTGSVHLDAEQTMIPLIRHGWPEDWTEPEDSTAWQPWTTQP